MALVPFKYYLHDGYNGYERVDYILNQCGIDFVSDDVPEWNERIGEPFYEVTLKCILDTETGEVSVEDIDL